MSGFKCLDLYMNETLADLVENPLLAGTPGTVIGPILGGAITQHSTWRWSEFPLMSPYNSTRSKEEMTDIVPTQQVFYMNLPICGLAALAILSSHIPEQCPKPPFRETMRGLPQHLDLLGFALLGSSAAMLLLAVELAGDKGWSSAVVIGLFTGCAVLAVVFAAWNRRRGDDGLVPCSTVGLRVVWSAGVTFGAFVAIANVQVYFLPLYFQAVLGQSPSASGTSMLAGVGPQVVVGLLSGFLSEYRTPFCSHLHMYPVQVCRPIVC